MSVLSPIILLLDSMIVLTDCELEANVVYCKKSRQTERVMILEINDSENVVQVKNLRTENIQYKTLHWCRKNLIKE